MLVILVVVLLLFGNRLPMVMRSLGRSVNEFKRGVGDTDEDDDQLGEQRKVGKREATKRDDA
ncbi:MAG TPA: twin-arginine translocase TatA/TatE family subunit [Pirellulales bacterium]|jgi:sec-independent protein translocase protein TatA|nr:twin-arginine translocase TatA/TatE family subunit [Pirellulales bacterium]